MSVEKVGKKFRCRIYQGRGNRIASSPLFDRKQDALVWEAETKRKINLGEFHRPQDSVCIKAALEEYQKKLQTRTRKHQRDVLLTLATLIDDHDLKTVEDFSAEIVESYIRNATLSPCTVSRNVQHMKAFGKFLLQAGYTKENPTATVQKPRAKILKQKRALTQPELESALSAIKSYSPRLFDFCSFLAMSGCRRMEAITLEWSDVDTKRGIIRIHDKPHLDFRCKWGSSREIPISDAMSRLLSQIPRGESSFVFQTNVGSRMGNNLNRGLAKALKQSDIERPSEVNFHTFRHTFITRTLEAGVDLRAVMEYAGHRHLSTTQKYLHSSQGQEKRKLDASRFVQVGIDLDSGTHRAPKTSEGTHSSNPQNPA